MRVLVCGGRDFSDEHTLNTELNDLLWRRGRFAHVNAQATAIIHGTQRGADMMAGAFAIACGLEEIRFKPDWNKHGKAAGPIRNAQMLAEGKPDLVVAFPGNSGTADMVTKARRAGVEVIEVPCHVNRRSSCRKTCSS